MEMGLVLSNFLVEVIFPILGAIILFFLALAAKKLDKKFDTDIFTENIYVIEKVAEYAISYAEEKATTKAKKGIKLTGQEKLDLAIAFVMEKVPSVSKEQASTWIESILNRRR